MYALIIILLTFLFMQPAEQLNSDLAYQYT